MIANSDIAVETFSIDQLAEVVMPSSRGADELDELMWSLEVSGQAAKSVQLMAKAIHGEYGGSVPDLQQSPKGLTRGKAPGDTVGSISQSVFEGKSAKQVSTSIKRINKTIFKDLPSPLLRYYVSLLALSHPIVFAFLQANAMQFPYFAPISESLGTLYVQAKNVDMTDAKSWCTAETVPSMRKSLLSKLPSMIASQVDKGSAAANKIVALSLPANSFLVAYQQYSEAKPHGLSMGNDQLYAPKLEEAKPKMYEKLKETYKDQLRLLDAFFPVHAQYVVTNGTYSVPVNGTKVTIDKFGELLAQELPTMKGLIFDSAIATEQSLV